MSLSGLMLATKGIGNMTTTVKAYATLLEFFSAAFPEDEWTDEDVEHMEIGGVDEDGNELVVDISMIRDRGCYGMCHPQTSTILLWLTSDANIEDVFDLVGHEVGHAFLEGEDSKEFSGMLQNLSDFVISEKAACEIGGLMRETIRVVVEAYRQVGLKTISLPSE